MKPANPNRPQLMTDKQKQNLKRLNALNSIYRAMAYLNHVQRITDMPSTSIALLSPGQINEVQRYVRSVDDNLSQAVQQLTDDSWSIDKNS